MPATHLRRIFSVLCSLCGGRWSSMRRSARMQAFMPAAEEKTFLRVRLTTKAAMRLLRLGMAWIPTPIRAEAFPRGAGPQPSAGESAWRCTSFQLPSILRKISVTRMRMSTCFGGLPSVTVATWNPVQ